jgi:hypothetical protein
MTDKPPKWDDNDAMVPWMHRKLDERQAAEASGHRRTAQEYHAWLEADGPEIYYAEHGNVEPLRTKYPNLAPFLHAPTKRKQKNELKTDAISTAVWAVGQISKIWREEYKLKKRPYRSRAQISAVEIAALWIEVDPEDIKTRMHPRGKKKLSRAD